MASPSPAAFRSSGFGWWSTTRGPPGLGAGVGTGAPSPNVAVHVTLLESAPCRPRSPARPRTHRHRAGTLGHTAFKAAEDRAVNEAIALQERAGLDVISDGEQRRDVFASQLVQASDGFGVVSGNAVDWFAMDGTVEHSPVTVG